MSIVSVLRDEKSFGDWLYSNVNVLNTTEQLKMVKALNFMLRLPYHNYHSSAPIM